MLDFKTKFVYNFSLKGNSVLSAYNLERKDPIISGTTHEAEAIECYRNMGASVFNTGMQIMNVCKVYMKNMYVVIRTPIKYGTYMCLTW